MAKLGYKSTKQVELPSSKDKDESERAWVIIKEQLLAEDVEKILEAATGMSSNKEGIASAVVDWNFYDDNNNKVPITPESVGQLDIEDFAFLADMVMGMFNQFGEKLKSSEKKVSSVTSPQPVTETPTTI